MALKVQMEKTRRGVDEILAYQTNQLAVSIKKLKLRERKARHPSEK